MADRAQVERDYQRALESLDAARRSLRPTSRTPMLGVTNRMLERAYQEERQAIEELYRGRLSQSDGGDAGQHARAETSGQLKSIISAEETSKFAEYYRRQGRKIVFTNGCFDILHGGHITYLAEAKQLGDVLIVGLNSDDSVTRLKGPGRPVMTIEHRSAVLAELSSVDHVVVFDTDTAEGLVEQIRPDVYVKGGDYRPEYLPPEAVVAQRHGAIYRTLSYVEGVSTSYVIERIKQA